MLRLPPVCTTRTKCQAPTPGHDENALTTSIVVCVATVHVPAWRTGGISGDSPIDNPPVSLRSILENTQAASPPGENARCLTQNCTVSVVFCGIVWSLL